MLSSPDDSVGHHALGIPFSSKSGLPYQAPLLSSLPFERKSGIFD